ncbi:MAG: hypothetical protein AAF668_11500, partial [Pseudomonadota bacterium]
MSGDAVGRQKTPVILITAVEPSADTIGAEIIREIRSAHPDAEIVGCGGPLMQAEGLESILAVDKLSVMGVADLAGAILFALVAARDLGA